ncbi:unnamed protein product [Arabidopsis halleri]
MVTGDTRVLVGSEQDTTMVDIGERDQPPGEPPDVAGSWVQKVTSSSAGGILVPEKVLADEFVSARLQLEFPNVHNCPKGVPDRVVETLVQNVPAAVNESRQTEEGFTLVRRQGRRTGIPANRILGNIRQNPVNINAGNIPISNRFGGLDEDTISQTKEGFNQSVGNKENESESRRGIKGKDIAHVNEGASGRTVSKGKGGNIEGWKEKRAGGSRPVEINGPKFKNSKQIRPSRGLVFGPIRKKFELLESGKRQRIDNGDVGKVAGYFAKEGESSLADQTQLQNIETVNDEAQGNRESHSQNMEIVMPKDPPEKEAALTVA